MPRLLTRIKAAARGLTATLAREYAATRLAQIRLAIADDEAALAELQLDLQRLRGLLAVRALRDAPVAAP